MSGIAHGSPDGPKKIFGKENVNWAGPKKANPHSSALSDAGAAGADFGSAEDIDPEDAIAQENGFADAFEYDEAIYRGEREFHEGIGNEFLKSAVVERLSDFELGKNFDLPEDQWQSPTEIIDNISNKYDKALHDGTQMESGGYFSEDAIYFFDDARSSHELWWMESGEDGSADTAELMVDKEGLRNYVDSNSSEIDRFAKALNPDYVSRAEKQSGILKGPNLP